MRKSYLFLASTAILLASCANDELENGTLPLSSSDTQAIGFNLKTAGMTRATEFGSAAATKLANEFVVYGAKHTNAEDGTADNDVAAFLNYKVEYETNSTTQSASNTTGWEYVGKTPYNASMVWAGPSTDKKSVNSQSIKYWDYSASKGYTFTAFSGKDFLSKGGTVQKITADPAESGKSVYAKGYEVSLPAGTSLDNVYFSDRVEVAKSNYGNPVVLTFRNFGARVRVGFYETVPGYSVKIDKFYCDDDASEVVTTYKAMDKDGGNAFVAALQNVNPSPVEGETKLSNTVTVTYGTGKDDDIAENQPKVHVGSTPHYQYTLTLGEGIVGKVLGESSDKATWDSNTVADGNSASAATTGDYTTVYPNLDCTQPMLIRCDYTLTADDDSGEEIKVKNARVVVPTQYVQWKSNYAYTYLFKISKNTNGTTGNIDPDHYDNPGTKPDTGKDADDPEGLFPISFDAVTIAPETYTQETATTVSTNSVTSYALNSDLKSTSEYKGGATIYFVDHTTNSTSDTKKSVIRPINIGDDATNAQVYAVTGGTTEAEVLAKLTGSNNGVTLKAVNKAEIVTSVPSADGTNITVDAVKFTAGTPTDENPLYYAYVYCNEKYVAKTYSESTASSFDENTTYYFKTANGVYYVASGINKDNFDTYKANLYTCTNASTAKDGSYDVKVVKVVK